MVEHDLSALRTPASGEDEDAVVLWRGCLRLLSAPVRRVGDFLWKRHMRLRNKEKTMPQSQHAQAAELHTYAAYAHAAAECQHSSGDHISAQDLTRVAYECSQEAARLSRAIAKDSIEFMRA
jgi:hypothetical protein